MAERILDGAFEANSKLAPAYVGTDEVRIDGVDGQLIATVFNFPIHGTVQGSNNLSLSSNVSGAIERRTEELTGSVGFFLNGTEGDVSPSANEGESAWGRAQNPGRRIAEAIVFKRDAMVVAPAQRLAHFGQEIDVRRFSNR